MGCWVLLSARLFGCSAGCGGVEVATAVCGTVELWVTGQALIRSIAPAPRTEILLLFLSYHDTNQGQNVYFFLDSISLKLHIYPLNFTLPHSSIQLVYRVKLDLLNQFRCLRRIVRWAGTHDLIPNPLLI